MPRAFYVLFALVLPCYAQSTTYYTVECTLFEHLNRDIALNSETWPEHPGLPDWRRAINLHHSQLTGYQLLKQPSHEMMGIVHRLKRDKTIRPLVTLAWQQPVTHDRGHAIRIFGGPQIRFTSNHAATPRYRVEGTVDVRPAKIPRVTIDLLLRVARTNNQDSRMSLPQNKDSFDYFDDDAQIVLPDPIVDEPVRHPSDYHTFRLKQTRRVKPDKIYYFDHPMFGVILRVSKTHASQQIAGTDNAA